MNFEDLWNYIVNRCERKSFPLVQNKEELEYVFNLMRECSSYLEVGTAEGNSLYVLTQAMKDGSSVTYLDKDEERIRPKREEIVQFLAEANYTVRGIHNDSHAPLAVKQAWSKRYDVVMIDAGHKYDDVIQDARNFAPLADKYVFFHDIKLPSVAKAFEEYKEESGMSGYSVINSENFGYGVLTV